MAVAMALRESDVIVVGAGIVGACCAAYLQRDGFKVKLIDRSGPGEACSFGNAGGMGPVSIPPFSSPKIFRRLPGMLVDRDSALALRWRTVPRSLKWFVNFVRSSVPSQVGRIADARRAILRDAMAAFQPLLADAGASDLVTESGWLTVFESDRTRRNAEAGYELCRRRGIKVVELSGDEVRELEPALGPSVRSGVLLPEGWRTTNPLRLTQAIMRRFIADGGDFRNERALAIQGEADGSCHLVAEGGRRRANKIVLAAGVWSEALARPLGNRVPLMAVRGYHTVIADAGVTIARLVSSADRSFGAATMETGLRLGTMAEFADADAPPDHDRAERIFRRARGLFPGLKATAGTRWVGARPCTPDSLPVIGPAPRAPSVLFAFGHGHSGLAMGAATGRMIADLARGRPPAIDLAPYRPDRF